MPKGRELQRVTRAAEKVRAAQEEYRAAIVAARDAGHTFSDIGASAGVAEQAARSMYLRSR
jgi:hypothetical protein